LHVLYLST